MSASPGGAYGALLWLYPRRFRDDYREDLVQHFADLVVDRGWRAAWGRTTVDLIVTVPRYRLESLMSESHTTTAITTVIALCVIGGAMSFLTDVFPGGALLLVVAVGLAIVQRSALARAIRTPDTNRRRRRIATAGVLAMISVVTIISYLRAVSAEHVSGLSLVLHNAIGVPAMVGAVIFLVVGLLTPKAAGSDLGSTPAT